MDFFRLLKGCMTENLREPLTKAYNELTHSHGGINVVCLFVLLFVFMSFNVEVMHQPVFVSASPLR